MKQAKAKKGPRRIVRQLYKDKVFIRFLAKVSRGHPVTTILEGGERIFVLGEALRVRKITSG